ALFESSADALWLGNPRPRNSRGNARCPVCVSLFGLLATGVCLFARRPLHSKRVHAKDIVYASGPIRMHNHRRILLRRGNAFREQRRGAESTEEMVNRNFKYWAPRRWFVQTHDAMRLDM